MTIERFPIPNLDLSKEDTADELEADALVAAPNLDEYVKVMTGLRGGPRPILCW
jgi:hypothetical protein